MAVDWCSIDANSASRDPAWINVVLSSKLGEMFVCLFVIKDNHNKNAKFSQLD